MGIFHGPLPVGYFSAFSSCLDCCVWSGLSVFRSGSFLLWRFYPEGGVGRLACQGFLVKKACVGVLVGVAGFLSGVQWSVQ